MGTKAMTCYTLSSRMGPNREHSAEVRVLLAPARVRQDHRDFRAMLTKSRISPHLLAKCERPSEKCDAHKDCR
jgi:hypothetical protein